MAAFNDSKTVLMTSGKAALVARAGPLAGRKYDLAGKFTVIIGRSDGSDITLTDDLNASRSHCEIGRVGAEWAARDLKSANGTFVGGIRVGPQFVRLEDGDLLRVGSNEFEFVAHSVSAAVEPEPGVEKFVDATAAKLREVLEELGVSVKELDVQKAQVGAAYIRFRVKVAASTKISSLRSRAEDIGRELGTQSTPFIDNVPGETYVGIDIPRPVRATVELTRKDLTGGQGSIPFLLGVQVNGERIHLDLADLPHLLVAGATGSGKSVFLQSLLLSAMNALASKDLEVAIIDPKQTDFRAFRGAPHLHRRSIVTEPGQAIAFLRHLVNTELVERTAVLERAGARNLRELKDQKRGVAPRNMLVVVDEYADLVMQLDKKQRKVFENGLCRLAQRARSVGIHLVLATQRPSVDVITGLIKTNLPCRIAFRLPSRVDSKTILDTGGAENLLGKGDMLLLKDDQLRRVQGLFVSNEFVKTAVGSLR